MRVEKCPSTQASTVSEDDDDFDEKVWITIIDKNTDMPEYDGKWLPGDKSDSESDTEDEEKYGGEVMTHVDQEVDNSE